MKKVDLNLPLLKMEFVGVLRRSKSCYWKYGDEARWWSYVDVVTGSWVCEG